MSAKIQNPNENLALQPAYGLWQQYQPENALYAFRAKSLAAAQAWQTETHAALVETIGLRGVSTHPLQPELIESVDKAITSAKRFYSRPAPTRKCRFTC